MTPAPSTPAGPGPQQWAIVELMGHTRLAGLVSEQAFGGCTVVRIDVPEVRLLTPTMRNGGEAIDRRHVPMHTRLLTLQAIYAINWVDEATALAAAHAYAHEPVNPYSLARAIDRMDEGCLQRMLHGTPAARREPQP
jgi:hypothetical protein